MQRALLQFDKRRNWPMIREALRSVGREDLIGMGRGCLVPSDTRGTHIVRRHVPGSERSAQTAEKSDKKRKKTDQTGGRKAEKSHSKSIGNRSTEHKHTPRAKDGPDKSQAGKMNNNWSNGK